MAQTAFVGVQWQPLDLIDEAKMDDLANSVQWVHDNTPRAKYRQGHASSRTQGVKILSGKKQFPKMPKKDSHTYSINFGNFFSSGCRPMITTGVNSSTQNNIFVTFRGFKDVMPDHNGMYLEIQVGEANGEKSKINETMHIHYIAVGY